MAKCHFCGDNEAIQNSHILPKYIFTWLKESSPTNYLRATDTPNRREQDGRKNEILCLKCENQFSKLENKFKAEVFEELIKDPSTNSLDPKFTEDSIKCALVIAWRSGVNFLLNSAHKKHTLEARDYSLIDESLEQIKKAINGRTGATISCATLTPAQVLESGFPDYSNNAYFYDRGVGEDVRCHDEKLMAFIKLPRAIIWITPRFRNLATGSYDCDLNPKLNEIPVEVPYVLNGFISSFKGARDALSDSQKSKIAESYDASRENNDWKRSANRQSNDGS